MSVSSQPQITSHLSLQSSETENNFSTSSDLKRSYGVEFYKCFSFSLQSFLIINSSPGAVYFFRLDTNRLRASTFPKLDLQIIQLSSPKNNILN